MQKKKWFLIIKMRKIKTNINLLKLCYKIPGRKLYSLLVKYGK